MNKSIYKFAIVKGRKGLYNGEMKRIQSKIAKDDIPRLVPGGKDMLVYGTPNRKLVQHLVDIHLCETPEMIMEEIKKAEVRKERAGEFINEEGAFMHTKFAEWLYKESNHYFLLIRENDELYYYKDGIYVPNGESYIGEIIQSKIDWQANISTAHVREIIGNIKRSCVRELDVMKGHKNLITCKNGVVDLMTMELLPSSPEQYSFKRVPLNYNPDAICHNIDDLIYKLIPDEDVQYKLDIMIGYTLINSYLYNKIFFLYGPPGTGKTTIINIIAEMLGDENISSVRLHDLIERPFMRVDLINSYANFSGDASNEPIKDGSVLKILSGDGRMSIDKKNVPNPISLKNSCKLIIDTNEMPAFDSNDDALYRRFIRIVFSNVIPKEDKTSNFMEALLLKDELEGLFARAVEMAHIILTTPDPFIEMSIAESKTEHEINSWNVVDDFIRMHVTIIHDHEEDDIFEINSDVWVEFKSFMDRQHVSARERVSVSKFYELFQKKCDIEKPKRKMMKGVSKKVYYEINMHDMRTLRKGFTR